MEREKGGGENVGGEEVEIDGTKKKTTAAFNQSINQSSRRFLSALPSSNRLRKVTESKIATFAALTSEQSDVQGGAALVVALVQIGAVGICMGGARVKVGICRSRRGLGEQGAEELGVSRVGSIVEGTVCVCVCMIDRKLGRESERA